LGHPPGGGFMVRRRPMRKALTVSASPLLLLLVACGGNQMSPAPNPPPIASASATASTVASTAPTDTAPAGVDAGAPAPAATATYTMTPVALPGATGPVSLDYLAVDRTAGKVWVPAGGTGSVDVIDTATKQISHIDGFPTIERTMRNQKRMVGTSSASIGDGVVYVGNRADSSICAIDAQKMTKGVCLKLAFSPDGVAYVPSVKEVWATTPRDSSITVLDAGTPGKLTVKTKITLPGSPEGYAVDDGRGLFYTNLEDKNKTLVIDVKTHKVTQTWDPQCGSDGPRGIAVDTTKQILMVACTDRVKSMDATSGVAKSMIDGGQGGIDNIDYVPSLGQLFFVAGKEAKLTVASVDAQGAFTLVGTGATSDGTRVVVADAQGNAYVADGKQGRILVLSPGH
jgi:DNA-binding beta-propeller fold protein YncE